MNIYQENFTIRHSEVDMYNKLKMKSLFDFIQESAANHANILGVGMEKMLEHNLIWVLSRVHLKIIKQPKAGDKIIIKTYPTGRERLFYRREFEVCEAKSGEIICYGSSFWLVVDLIKNRAVREFYFANEFFENPELEKKLDYQTNFVEFNSPESNIDFVDKFKVNYSSIDINKHLNNANYAMIVEDIIFNKLADNFQIQEIQISFNIAQKVHDEISISLINEDDKFQIVGKNSSDKIIFDASCVIS